MAIVLSLLPIAINAQTHEDLKKLYVEAAKRQSSKDCLPIADELMHKATQIGDKTAQCLAANIKMVYYYGAGSEQEFNESALLLKKLAKEANILQLYYFAYQYQVLRLSNSGQSAEALKVAEQMQKEAIHDNNAYGISNSYKSIADIYFGRSDLDNAKLYYKKGLDFLSKNNAKQDVSIYYAMLAMIARKETNYQESLKYSEEGLKRTINKASIADLELSRASSLLYLERYKEFLDQLKDLDTKTGMFGMAQMDTYNMLKVQACILDKKYDEALTWADKNRVELNRLEQRMVVYEAMGDWKNAYEYHRNVSKMKQERASQIQSKDLAEANAKFRNERLQSENLKLELTNAQNKLEAAKSLARQKEADAQNAKLEAYNKELKLHNSDLTLAQFKAENSLKKAEIERQQAKLQSQRAETEKESQKHHFLLWLLGGGIATLTLIIIMLVRGRVNTKRFIKTLKHKNDELAIERDKAQQSERMKTMFIQNISHEIRTPLNAIVGFSDLMLTPDMELENEEKENFKNIIHQNSDLLTGLVNDVLTLSELQSGKAKLNVVECNCNALCRAAIDTVMHRKPKDVELIFTTNVADDFTIKSDSRRISQVLINFLTNAEKYTSQGSISLDCSASKTSDIVTFTVTDTGCGIPKDKQAKIFGRFEKLDDFHQGIGLGLNICALIANLLDAKIGIDSSYDKGAKFYFSIKS